MGRSYSSRGHFKLLDPIDLDDMWIYGQVRAGRTPWRGIGIEPRTMKEALSRFGEKIAMVYVSGDSMMGAGINPGDILTVVRGIPQKFGDIVAVDIGEDEPLVKRWTPVGIYSQYDKGLRVREQIENKATIIGVVGFHTRAILQPR